MDTSFEVETSGTRIISSRPVVENLKKDLLRRCASLKTAGIIPSMSVVLVGKNPASLAYIRNKKKLCEEVGARFQLEQLEPDVTKAEFLRLLADLNHNPSIHGIIIQLPVSEQLRTLDLPHLVTPAKDIDGFHSANYRKLYEGSGHLGDLLPCTPKGIVSLLQHYDYTLPGKHVVIVGRSLIVGKPLGLLLTNLGATVTLAHSQTRDLRDLTRVADIVVTAIGRAKFFDFSFFNPGRRTVVIDVGMNELQGKLVGDVDAESVNNAVAALSPVPGGVGPMTVVSLIDNLITAAEASAQLRH
ncbi:MAG TPA: bifunctional 5,10-methylenetetrahydrofolate dehydrogenase/5,10-methenyltetrahydrofolate cyclohydrolase [Bacteriovoracaceae bacterium]|nr:bifunctional 5,10-methylenetetrahydrofolate dehydrogenase/5,10-methenyltetrahydrofolate cyclohydrolase [Bacteriovoracaceae bacterium]